MKKTLLLAALAVVALGASAQKKKAAESPKKIGYTFTDTKINPATSVKNQASSGTCWSFSGVAFIESDLIKNGKGEHDLSEMWIVRHTYLDKAIKYARMHGNSTLSAGGATHDVFNAIDAYGIVPEEVYTGLNYGTEKHQHGELDNVLKAYMDAVIKNPNRTLSTAWIAGVNGILDAYLGAVPKQFTYQGKEYTPRSFADALGIKGSNYQSYTSFTHHPFGTEFAVEVPDNWAWGLSKNVPLSELIAVVDRAIENGGTIFWASDVSEKGFQHNKGFAVLPDWTTVDTELAGSEAAKWTTMTAKEKEEARTKYDVVLPEIEVTQELRQKGFDNYQTTDDHGMQIVGSAVGADGKKYYKVKNSWDVGNPYGGYFYVSVPFLAAKTTNLVVAK